MTQIKEKLVSLNKEVILLCDIAYIDYAHDDPKGFFTLFNDIPDDLLVLIAAELAETGKSAAEIAAALEELVPKVEVSFILDTLEYLRRGGRCSSLAALGANMLSIHPTIAVVNNSMQVGRKYRGSLKRCIGQYTQAVLQNAAAYDDGHLFITTSGWDEADIAAVRQALAAAGFDAVAVTDAGCTVCAHCGPLCGGIITLRK